MKVFFDDATTLTGARTIPRAMVLVYGTRSNVELEAVTAQDNLPIDLEAMGCKEWKLEIKPAFSNDSKVLLSSLLDSSALQGNKFSFSLGLFSMSLYRYTEGRSKSPALLSMSGYAKVNDPESKLTAFEFLINVQGRTNINVDTCSTSSLEALGEALSEEIEARKAGDNDLQDQIDRLVITGGQVTVNGIMAVDGDITLNLGDLKDVSQETADLLKSIKEVQSGYNDLVTVQIGNLQMVTKEILELSLAKLEEELEFRNQQFEVAVPLTGSFPMSLEEAIAASTNGELVYRTVVNGVVTVWIGTMYQNAVTNLTRMNMIKNQVSEEVAPDTETLVEIASSAGTVQIQKLTLDFGSGYNFTGRTLNILFTSAKART